jgi:ZIP family zinc transporter
MFFDAQFVAVMLLALLSVFTTVAGVLLAAAIRDNARAIAGGIGFSAGIMILVSMLELIPAARTTAASGAVLATALFGATLLWLMNRLIPHSHIVSEHGEPDTRLVRSAYMVVVGLILHDVPEGFAMANAYVSSPSLGVLVALAIALHNLPEEFAMALPAMAIRGRPFLVRAAVLSALAEPLGALIGLVAVGMTPALNGYFMAFAAGAMLFVSFHELLPMARRYGRLEWFGIGLAASAVVHRLLGVVTAR